MPQPGFDTHPKFRKALRRLRVPTAHLRGYLVSLWEHGYSHGALVGDAEAVEDAAGWWEAEGEEGKLVEVLVEVGFLDAGEDGFSIHDLYENAPDYIRKRRAREIANEAGLPYETGPKMVRQAVREGVIGWETPDLGALRRWADPNGAERQDSAPDPATRRHSAPSGAEQRRTATGGAERRSPLLSSPLRSAPEDKNQIPPSAGGPAPAESGVKPNGTPAGRIMDFFREAGVNPPTGSTAGAWWKAYRDIDVPIEGLLADLEAIRAMGHLAKDRGYIFGILNSRIRDGTAGKGHVPSHARRRTPHGTKGAHPGVDYDTEAWMAEHGHELPTPEEIEF